MQEDNSLTWTSGAFFGNATQNGQSQPAQSIFMINRGINKFGEDG